MVRTGARARWRTVFALAAFATIAVCSACSTRAPTTVSPTNAEDDALGDEGAEANEAAAQATTLTAALTLTPSVDEGDASPRVGVPSAEDILASRDRVRALFEPDSCVTSSADASKGEITYTFDACTAAWGVAGVSGTLVTTYRTTMDEGRAAIAISARASALRIGGAKVSYEAEASVTGSRNIRVMTWAGKIEGRGARGRRLERQASWTVAWRVGQSCIRLEGHAEGLVEGRLLTTDVQDYQRCRGGCPQRGGSVRITDVAKDRFVEISFTGADTASLRRADGSTSIIPLACGR